MINLSVRRSSEPSHPGAARAALQQMATEESGALCLEAFGSPFHFKKGNADLDAIRRHALGRRSFRPHTEMLNQNEIARDVLMIVDGLACTYQLLDDGRRQILSFCLPGDLIGIAGSPHAPLGYAAAAITNVAVALLPQDRLLPIARTNPDFAMSLTRAVIASQALSQHHLTNVGRRTARERVASLLLELYCRVQGVSGSAVGEIQLPLTQEEIGDALGLTHFHVNRVLRALRNDHVVEFGNRVLRVLDVDRLAEEAGVEPGLFLSQAA